MILMDRLFSISKDLLQRCSSGFTRFLYNDIQLNYNLIGISGGKGVGKTTLLLQLMKNKLRKDARAMFVSLDDIFFASNSFLDFAWDFYRKGGEYLFLDDMHKYADAAKDLKEIKSEMPDLNLIFATSISLTNSKCFHGMKDEVRCYSLPGLSFREFLEYEYQLPFPLILFDELIELNRNPGSVVLNRIRPLQYFDEYLRRGYYPLQGESPVQLSNIFIKSISTNVATDLAAFFHIDYYSVGKINKLLFEIANKGPFKPNIEKLAELTGTTRDSLLKFISFLIDAGLVISIVGKDASTKPRRLYMNNSNLVNSINQNQDNTGKLHETFLINQLSLKHRIDISGDGTLIVDGEYNFRMEWLKGASRKSIPNNDYYSINEGIDFQSGTRIPLWMFGFLY